MPKDEIQKIINLLPLTDFFTYYGLTEASRSTFLLFNDDITKIESVGKPAPNVEIKIIPNNGDTNNKYEMGEVLIKGPNVIDEYWPGTTERTKIKDGWLQTGDLGYFDNDGYLYLKGRKDDIIILEDGRKIVQIDGVFTSELNIVHGQIIQEDYSNFTILHRMQWLNFDGAPESQSFTFSNKIRCYLWLNFVISIKQIAQNTSRK